MCDKHSERIKGIQMLLIYVKSNVSLPKIKIESNSGSQVTSRGQTL